MQGQADRIGSEGAAQPSLRRCPPRWLLLSLLLRDALPCHLRSITPASLLQLHSGVERIRSHAAAQADAESDRLSLCRLRRLARPLAFALFLLCLPANPKNSGPKAAAISVVYAGVFAYMYFKAEDITVSGGSGERGGSGAGVEWRGMGWLRAAWLLLFRPEATLLALLDGCTALQHAPYVRMFVSLILLARRFVLAVGSTRLVSLCSIDSDRVPARGQHRDFPPVGCAQRCGRCVQPVAGHAGGKAAR